MLGYLSVEYIRLADHKSVAHSPGPIKQANAVWPTRYENDVLALGCLPGVQDFCIGDKEKPGFQRLGFPTPTIETN